MKKRLLAFLLAAMVTVQTGALAVDVLDSETTIDVSNIETMDISAQEQTITNDANFVINENVHAAISTVDFNNRLSSLRDEYPNYSTWTGTYDGGSQCWGFARLIADKVFGGDCRQWPIVYSISDVKAGDILQYGNTSGQGHTVFVTQVSGDIITFVDCNGNGNYSNGTKVRSCGIKWDNTIKKTANMFGKYSFSYLLSSPGISNVTIVDNPTVSSNKSSYTVGESATISWNSVSGATSYWLEIWYGGNQIVTSAVSGNSSYTLNNMRQGEYGIFVHAYNSNSQKTGSYSFNVNYPQGEQTICNGRFMLCSALDEDYVISISFASQESEANALLYKNENHTNQFFDITYLGDGCYKIIASHSGKSLDVYNNEMSSGTNVQQYGYSNGANQQWIIKPTGDGYYYIISKCNGLYLDVYGGNSGNNVNIDVWRGDGQQSVKWKLKPVIDGEQTISDGKYMFCSALDENYVISVLSASTESEANTILYKNENHANQIFDITYLGNGAYKIIASHSGKALDVYNNEMMNGANVQQYGYNGGANQQWVIKSAGEGYYYIISKCNGLYLDVYGGYDHNLDANGQFSGNGVNIDVWTGYGQQSVKWKLAQVISSCTVTLETENILYDGTAKKPAVTVRNGSTTLVNGTDYTVSYSNNINVGTATVTITGKNNYIGTIVKTFTIKDAPLSIISQPSDFTGVVGANATFKVEANGSNLTYQWQYANAGTDYWRDSSQTGSKTATLSVPITMARNGQKYRCVITDASGNVATTNAAVLTAETVPLAITAQPVRYSGSVGSTATFTVKATGTGLTYQWQFKNATGTVWANSSMTGNKTATLSVPVTSVRNDQQYRCVITDVNGNTVISDAAILKVQLQITSQPKDYSGTVGSTAKFTVAATGAGMSYQWQVYTTASGAWKNSSMTGSQTATLSVPVTAARNGQQYRCIITDANSNKITSGAATLTALAAIKITTQPSSYTGTVGTTATFTVKATGNGLTYQWQFKNTSGTAWANSSMTGNKTATLSVPITAARNGQQYRCVIKDASGGTATSNAATLTAKAAAITIHTQPLDYTGTIGKTATFTVKATGNSLTYQWQYANAGQEDAWRASSQTGNKTATLSVPITLARDGQKYRVVITDGSGNTATSNAAMLHVGTVLAITSQPSDYTGRIGETATFTVKATGDGLTYQWQYENAGQEDAWRASSQTGNKTTTLTVPITAARDGQKYRVVITDSSGNTVTSNAATLKVS